jgi:hypothetical protein
LIAGFKAWAREPLVHFLLIGTVAFLLLEQLAESEGRDDERAVFVSASDVNAMIDQWQRAWMRPPTDEEFAHIIRAHVRTKVLYKEALAMGLDAGDTAIEQRLAQKVELLARSLNTPSKPTDDVLRAWYAENAGLFKQPDLYSVAQVFFDPGVRAASVQDDARVAMAQLEGAGEVPPDFASYGDRSTQPNRLDQYTELELRRLFGSQLADEVVALEPGRWHGPLMSAYGMHLVWVNEVRRFPPPSFEAVKVQAQEQWMAEQIEAMSERYVDELVSRYQVIVEPAQATTASSGATP